MMTFRGLMVPIIVLALAALAVLPWGLSAQWQLLPPFGPALAIYILASGRRSAVLELVAFVAGLSVDALTQGPLGYWSLIYLAAIASAVLPVPAGRGLLARWVMFLPVALGLVVFAYLVAIFYGMALLPPRPFVVALIFVWLAFPIAALVLSPVVKTSRAASEGSLLRGGRA